MNIKSTAAHNQLTKEKYEHQKSKCDGLCDIDEHKIAVDNPNLLMCVQCPFCSVIVNARLTKTTISCPACKITVKR
jgi:hypothetical protein